MVFQSYALYPHMSVEQNIGFGLKNRRVAAPEIAERVKKAAAMLEIGHLLDRRPRNLSGGQGSALRSDAPLCARPGFF